jgi:hypothetical protein
MAMPSQEAGERSQPAKPSVDKLDALSGNERREQDEKKKETGAARAAEAASAPLQKGMAEEAKPRDASPQNGALKATRAWMDFDLATTTRRVGLAADGGHIEVIANDQADTALIEQIRTRLRAEAEALNTAGSAVTSTFESVDHGGRIRMSTSDQTALQGVHDLLRSELQRGAIREP